MPLFRKKPDNTIYEVDQWFPGKELKGVFAEREASDGGNGLSPEPAMAFVRTIHGQTTKVVAGDWIMPEPDGEHYYPIKPDIFTDRYEPVEEAETEHA